MKFSALLLPVALFPFSAFAGAPADTAHARAVYEETNVRLGSLQKVTARVKGDHGAIALTGWIDDGRVRKIVARPGNTGTGADEFYLEDGRPLFVFGTSVNGQTGKKVEERVYFADGRIAKWLTTDKIFVPHGEDYDGFSKKLNADCATFLAALQPKSAAKPDADLRTTTGTFVGIEPGDYFHWKMRAVSGKNVSYFMIKPDATVERVMADPQEYAGHRCRVRWKTTVENLPEAGGKTKIDQIVSVEWLPAE